MVRRKIMGLFVCTLILGMASFAFAFVPDLATSSANTAYHAGGGTEVVSVFTLPSGGGFGLNAAFLSDGSVVDATVTLYVRDSAGTAIAAFPSEDMWLASAGMVPCVGGSIADQSTDENGMTVWATALQGGGFSTGITTQVIISGDALTSSGGMGIKFNSADADGTGLVDLADVTSFSVDFYGSYNYRSDFVYDGVLDLADVTRLAVGIGASCP